jgi:hypothetical protein
MEKCLQSDAVTTHVAGASTHPHIGMPVSRPPQRTVKLRSDRIAADPYVVAVSRTRIRWTGPLRP